MDSNKSISKAKIDSVSKARIDPVPKSLDDLALAREVVDIFDMDYKEYKQGVLNFKLDHDKDVKSGAELELLDKLVSWKHGKDAFMYATCFLSSIEHTRHMVAELNSESAALTPAHTQQFTTCITGF